jgi:hypothetical protein
MATHIAGVKQVLFTGKFGRDKGENFQWEAIDRDE